MPRLMMQTNIFESGPVFKNTAISTEVFISVLVILAILTLVCTFGAHYYRKFKKIQEFKDELTQLELDQDQENAMVELIKRYAMNEPVEILMSVRLFDEMAAKEINRILASSGSSSAKQNFVNMVYDIRKKTFYPDMALASDQQGQQAVHPAGFAHESA